MEADELEPVELDVELMALIKIKWILWGPMQNCRHFADGFLKRIFFNGNVWISIKTSLTYVPKGPINNESALVQVMALRRKGDKPLSEQMMT